MKRIILFVLIVFLCLTACGGSTPAQSTAAETTSAAPAAQETTAAPETTAIRETAAAPAESAAETASETAAVPEETVALDTLTPDPAYDFWNGDWFGWWEATDPQGDWVQLKDLKIALLCQIRIAKNGRAVLMLWDNNLPRTDAICEISLRRLPLIVLKACVKAPISSADSTGRSSMCRLPFASWVACSSRPEIGVVMRFAKVRNTNIVSSRPTTVSTP